MESKSESGVFMIGWREWVQIPKLGLPGIKAKVDTGARTCALHSFKVESFTERGHQKVAFWVHPLQGRNDIEVVCEANVVDYRSVSDSGGHREKRYVIEVPIILGLAKWTVEMTLANRETMNYRMLLGRSAMKSLIIDPRHSYLAGPKPPGLLRAYKKKKRA